MVVFMEAAMKATEKKKHVGSYMLHSSVLCRS
jgi:hypothetical protein